MEVPRVGVGVLLFDAQCRLLLGQRIGSHGAHTWGPPGGHLAFGETPEACAQRELQEEVGLEIGECHLIGLTNDIFWTEGKHYISLFMQAWLPAQQVVRHCEPHRAVSWQWFTRHELPTPLFLPLQNFLPRLQQIWPVPSSVLA